MSNNPLSGPRSASPPGNSPKPATPLPPGANGQSSKQLTVIGLFLLVLIVGLGWFWFKKNQAAQARSGSAAGRPGLAIAPVPVVPGTVEQKDVPIYLDGLGTAQAFNTVTVRSRVDGQLQRVAFVEGQEVRAGDLLAQIDPAPFQAQYDQSVAKTAQDQAQLTVARLTLKRDSDLLASKIIAQQDYDTQEALVQQLEATVKADEAASTNARVQLDYSTITAPLDGRTGMRLVDPGNIIHTGDSNGLVVITQLRPIAVVFTLPERYLAQIQPHQIAGEQLPTLAMGPDNQAPLSEGKLAVVDNQIDISTGTIRLKAIFPNDDLRLWPGQFVNVRLLVATRKGGTVVPASVVQRGPDGTFAFVIDADLMAQVRKVTVAQVDKGQALIDNGLTPGERVVVDGQYKLQPGSKVKLPDTGELADPKPASRPANPAATRGENGKKGQGPKT
jgi:membrane fusion protein, multidrug efflux system